MKQAQFKFIPKKTVSKQRNQWDEANLRSAREILSNPDHHGGNEAFPVIWAHMVIERLGAA